MPLFFIMASARWQTWLGRLAAGDDRPALPPAPEGVEIRFLADDPCDPEPFARWLYAQWSAPRGETLDRRRASLSLHRSIRRLPLALVAYEAGEPAGIVCLRARDLHSREASPWLCALYVDAPRRGRGIGRALVAACEAVARHLGHRELYLFTTEYAGLYRSLGWQELPPLPAECRLSPRPVVFRRDLC